MRTTGIKDINETEICEDHIVKETFGRLSGNIESHILFVKWKEKYSKFELSNDIKNTGYGTTTDLTHNGLYEIIGNINDNPEYMSK